MIVWKTLGLRGRARGIFLKTQTSYRAQDRQKKSEQAKVRTLQRAVNFFSSRAWLVLMAPAWVLADERPSFTVDAVNPHVVPVLYVCNGSGCADLQEGDSFSGRSLKITPAPPFQFRRWHFNLNSCFFYVATQVSQKDKVNYIFFVYKD